MIIDVNSQPTGDPQAVALEANTNLTIVLAGSDPDATFTVASPLGPALANCQLFEFAGADTPLTFIITDNPDNGVLSAPGHDACQPGAGTSGENTDSLSVLYTPNIDFVGSDRFCFVVNDLTGAGNATSSEACVDITVEPGTPGILQGDADCNGVVNSVDALIILRALAGLPVPPPDVEEGCPAVGEPTS